MSGMAIHGACGGPFCALCGCGNQDEQKQRFAYFDLTGLENHSPSVGRKATNNKAPVIAGALLSQPLREELRPTLADQSHGFVASSAEQPAQHRALDVRQRRGD